MKIVSLGVGEAFDPEYANNSHLVCSRDTALLLDCGYSVVQQWLKKDYHPDMLDAVYISHLHMDHFLGLPVLLLHLFKSKRTRPIQVVANQDVIGFLSSFVQKAFIPSFSKFESQVQFVGVRAGQPVTVKSFALAFALTNHPSPNLAVQVNDGKHQVCYSGDGQVTPAAESLYAGSHLLIQETYAYESPPLGHGSVKMAICMAERTGVERLMLTHLERSFRKKELPRLRGDLTSNLVRIIIPNPLDEYEL